MHKTVLKIKYQRSTSYAKQYMPFLIVCCSIGNHLHFAGVSLSAISVVLYFAVFLLDYLTNRLVRSGNIFMFGAARHLKYYIFSWTIFALIQSTFIFIIRPGTTVFNELVSYGIGFVLFLSVVRFTDNESDLKKYALVIVGCTIAELMICHYEMITGNHVRDTSFRHYDMVFGTYYNENDLSVMLVLGALTIIFFTTFIKKTIFSKFVSLFLLADCFYIILYTRSRGGLLGFVFMLFMVFLSLILGRRYSVLKNTYRIMLSFGITIIIFVIIAGIVVVSDENDVARMNIYKGVFELLLSHPFALLFGFGAGQTKVLYDSAIHNYCLQLLGDFGISGFVLYCNIIFNMLKWPSLVISSISDSVRRTCVIVCALLTIVFGFVVSDYGSIKLSWIIIGLFSAENFKQSNQDFFGRRLVSE